MVPSNNAPIVNTTVYRSFVPHRDHAVPARHIWHSGELAFDLHLRAFQERNHLVEVLSSWSPAVEDCSTTIQIDPDALVACIRPPT